MSLLEAMLRFPIGTKVTVNGKPEVLTVIDHYDSDWATVQVRVQGMWGSTNYWPADVVALARPSKPNEVPDVTP